MIEGLVVILPVLLGLLIVCTEFLRKKRGPFDYLTLVNIVYFSGFAAGPILLYICDMSSLSHGWEESVNLQKQNFLMAGILPLIGYIALVSGYFSGNFFKLNISLDPQESKMKWMLLLGIVLLAAGASAYYVYAGIYGGLESLLIHSDDIRSEALITDSPFVFLRHLGAFCAISSFVFLAFARFSFSFTGWIINVLFIISFLATMYVYWTWAGRLTIIQYFATIYTSFIVIKKKWRITHVIILSVFSISLIVMGDSLFRLFLNPEGLEPGMEMRMSDPGMIIEVFASELAYPTFSLATAVMSFGSDIMPRWFIGDLIIGLAKLFPERLLNLDLPKSVSELNTVIGFPGATGTIPVDILSFSYYNSGFPGIIFWPFIYGMFVRLVEKFFIHNIKSKIAVILYAAWGIKLGSYVMYGDPDHFLQGNAQLIAGTVLILLLMGIKQAGSRRAKVGVLMPGMGIRGKV